jgi:hypothetical protein
VRKWTKSACMVIAWSILPIAMGVGSSGADHPAQATISIASSTQPTPADQPGTLMTITAAQVAAGPAATWTVRPGDTLSAIAATLALPGGWQALYAANRRVVGPDPDLIRAGIILVTPGPARTAAAHKKAPASAGAGSDRQQAQPRATASHRKVRELPGSPGALTVSVSRTASAAVMPRWLKDALLATGLLLVIAFTVEPALAIGRRRRRTARAAQERAAQESAPGESAAQEFAAQQLAAQQLVTRQRAAVKTARFVEAEHERLIVTYCAREDTVYLLTPPGEDPRAVLRAARLVLPEDTYEELAGHLGVPSGWPRE